MQVFILVWTFFTHLAGVYLFTRGFLLTRLSLPNISSPSLSLLKTHEHAILIVIDALRFDFISPHPPQPSCHNHHNVLTLPRDLTVAQPHHSFIFNAYADPPTSTMQRIKAITTGSLPTFVDIGNNFGANQVSEDSLLNQLSLQSKKLAFMGDDTWLSIYPSSFSPNLSFPFDSFNVEDLHTVDNGVISHFFPLLSPPSNPDFLVAHFLGVDHVGHRLGPDSPAMRSKLLLLNDFLNQTIQNLPPDTLLIVLGDHGMDNAGDHGGDGILETSSGLWIYSKDSPLCSSTSTIPADLFQYRTFPGSSVKSRAIDQIDLVPSLALLLGIPIPFNNLGTIIPELFCLDSDGQNLFQALSLNAEQIMTFLRAYRSSQLGSELDDVWESLSSSYTYATDPASKLTREQKLVAITTFTRSALEACRSIWAQFNATLMSFGLLVLFSCFVASFSLYINYARQQETDRDAWLATLIKDAGKCTLLLGLLVHTLIRILPFQIPYLNTVTLPHFILFITFLSSSLSIIFLSPLPFPSFRLSKSILLPLLPNFLPLLHSLSFTSNSDTFWEDHLIPFFLITSLLPYLHLSLLPKTPKTIRTRILTHLFLLTLCTRLMSLSTVCREEQQPYCDVTFYAARSVSEPPKIVLYFILPIALGLPSVIRRYFVEQKAKQHQSIRVFFKWVLRPCLLGGSAFWIVEWVDSIGFLSSIQFENMGGGAGLEWARILRKTRTMIAWFSVLWVFLGGGVCWWRVGGGTGRGRGIDASKADDADKDNSSNNKSGDQNENDLLTTRFLILWFIFFGIIWLCTQLMGQVILALSTIALFCYLEVVSCAWVAERLHSSPSSVSNNKPSSHLASGHWQRSTYPSPSPTPLALLALLTFFSTGHQASLSSIQWKTAFVLTENVRLSGSSPPLSSSPPSPWGLLMRLVEKAIVSLSVPLSGLTVVINSVGPVALWGGLGAGFVGCWLSSRHPDVDAGTDAGEANSAHTQHTENDVGHPCLTSIPPLPYPTLTTSTFLTTLSSQIYFLLLLLGSSFSSALLRRHLMVWNIFAPRFMVAVLELIVVDLGGLVGVLVGASGRRRLRRKRGI